MNLIAKYLTIPLLFSFLVACYAMFIGKHNQANLLGLFIYGTLFYAAPFFLLAIFSWFLNLSKRTVHSGFIGMTLALLIIASLWLLPPDPSGLPMQWMVYWPLALILSLAFICAQLFYTNLKKT